MRTPPLPFLFAAAPGSSSSGGGARRKSAAKRGKSTASGGGSSSSDGTGSGGGGPGSGSTSGSADDGKPTELEIWRRRGKRRMWLSGAAFIIAALLMLGAALFKDSKTYGAPFQSWIGAWELMTPSRYSREDNFHFYQVIFTDDLKGIGTGGRGGLLQTTDGGKSWKPVTGVREAYAEAGKPLPDNYKEFTVFEPPIQPGESDSSDLYFISRLAFNPRSGNDEIWAIGSQSRGYGSTSFLMRCDENGQWYRWNFGGIEQFKALAIQTDLTVWALVSMADGSDAVLKVVQTGDAMRTEVHPLPYAIYHDLVAGDGIAYVIGDDMDPEDARARAVIVPVPVLTPEAAEKVATEDTTADDTPTLGKLPLKLAGVHGLQYLDPLMGIALTQDGAFISLPDGKYLSRLPAGNPIHSVTPGPGGDGFWAYGGKDVLRSTEGGTAWQKVNGLESVNELQFNDEFGWAITDGRLLVSRDRGDTWRDPRSYLRLPPLLAFAFFALGLGYLISYLRWKVPPPPPETESIANLYLSDKPLENAKSGALDKLGGDLATFLANENTGAPLALAVCGAWGSGKTSLMRTARRRLLDKGFLPVWFNAWHHEDEEHFLAALLSQVKEEAIPPVFSWHGLVYRIELAKQRFVRRWPYAVFMAALFGFFLALFLQVGDKLLEELFTKDSEFLAASLKVILGGATAAPFAALLKMLTAFGVDPGKLAASATGAKPAQTRELTSIRQRFATEFDEVTRALEPLRMVIFIDDLDRCEADHLVKVLQTINFLSTSGQCFIVMGMEKRAVLAALGEKLTPSGTDPTPAAKSAYAKLWLEKLVQVEVHVPVLDDKEKQSIAGALEPTMPADEDEETEEEARPAFWSRQRLREAATGTWHFSVKTLPKVLAACVVAAAFWIGLDHGRSMRSEADLKARKQADEQAAKKIEEDLHRNTDKVPRKWYLEGKLAGVWDWHLTASNRPPLTSPADDEGEDTEETTTSDPEGVALRNAKVVPASTLPTESPAAGAVTVEVAEPQRSLAYLWWSLLLAALAGIGIGLVRHRINLHFSDVVKDSPDFRKAVNDWWPQIAGHLATPRSLKRFINRLRLYASLAGEQPPEQGEKPARQDAQENKSEDWLDEREIVGFGVLEDVCPALLRQRLPGAPGRPSASGAGTPQQAYTAPWRRPKRNARGGGAPDQPKTAEQEYQDLGDRQAEAEAVIARLQKDNVRETVRLLTAAFRV